MGKPGKNDKKNLTIIFIITRVLALKSNGVFLMTDRIYELFKQSVIVRPPKRGNKPDKNVSCYVLITCTHPNQKGQMEVNLTYEGDRVLASYLIKSSQDFFLD